MTNVTNDLSQHKIRMALKSPEQNEEIYQQFYKEYYPKIYSYCRIRTKSAKKAKVIAGRVFAQIHEKRHRLPPNCNFYAWMRQMSHTMMNWGVK